MTPVIQHSLEVVANVQNLLSESGTGIGIGAGVASGEVTGGAIGGGGRLEYVAVGAPVNLAARLCEQAADGEVLIDAAVHAQIAETLPSAQRPIEPMKSFGMLPAWALHAA